MGDGMLYARNRSADQTVLHGGIVHAGMPKKLLEQPLFDGKTLPRNRMG